MPKIYNYNWATNEYIGEGEADASPMEAGVYLLPAYATFKEPPAEEGMRAVFNREQGDWVLEPVPLPAMEEIELPTVGLFGGQTIGDLFDGLGRN